jgi:hypothetical protein
MCFGKYGLQQPLLRVRCAGIAAWTASLLMAVSVPPTRAAEASHQTTFESPAAAANALFLAAKSHDEMSLAHILGGGTEIINSDDEIQDRFDREQFVQKYQQMHRLEWGNEANKAVVLLYVGAETRGGECHRATHRDLSCSAAVLRKRKFHVRVQQQRAYEPN